MTDPLPRICVLRGDDGESLRDAVPGEPYSLALLDDCLGRLDRRPVGLDSLNICSLLAHSRLLPPEGAPMTLPNLVERLRCNGVREEHLRFRHMALSGTTKQTADR